MCNIAGYIGKKQAAPILVQMMKKQEGFGGGYYTGITTHSGKKLHTTKVLGEVQNLLNETDAISFPGTMGFLHSRSKSGGGVEWGHPFVCEKSGISYIANGTFGAFLNDENKKKRCDVISDLEKKGYTFTSRSKGMVGDYPFLSDGTAIHSSDAMCQYIASLIDNGKNVDEAMSEAYSNIPEEVVGLVIREADPGKIFVTRVNFPMMIGIADDGDTYLATTALAFPEDVNFRTIELLPPTTTFEVYEGGYKTSVHPVKIDGIAPITPDIWHKAYVKVEKLLTGREEAPAPVQDVIDACADVWEKGTVAQGAPLVYEIMRALKKEGRLKIARVRDEGAFEGYTADNFRLYI